MNRSMLAIAQGPLLLGFCAVWATLLLSNTLQAAPQDSAKENNQEPLPALTEFDQMNQWAADLGDILRPSVVEISYLGREGKPEGVGTGVIVDGEQGLVATNLHVIGQARPIVVKLNDGREPTVEQVWASDPNLDLAILKIKAADLMGLKLADSSKLRDGERVLAMGNPHGLRNSIVTGVSSGRREIGRKKLIQLAMAIEPGNSGGPLVNALGDVVGIISLKSNVTDNLGFAIESNQLQELLDRPNPIDMDRWLTIGTLPDDQWDVIGGASWRQRGGQLEAKGLGQGFGGRSLCLTQQKLPDRPFEIAVDVRLEDESGAAGLVFQADGAETHLGFYPSQTALRFSRFDGPTVFEWQVLKEQASPFYRPGEWNRLKVRCDADNRFTCTVNDQLVFEVVDKALDGTRVGLAKFRDTKAQFKNFQVAKTIAGIEPTPEVHARTLEQLASLPPWRELSSKQLAEMQSETPAAAYRVIEAEARRLETRAAELRRIKSRLQLDQCLNGLRSELEGDEIDLMSAALWISKMDEAELDRSAYLNRVSRMKMELVDRSQTLESSEAKLELLNAFLFDENGFHGSRSDYDHRANSQIHRVIDDREGIPVTLAVLYLELGQALELDVQGVGIPGHFMVRVQLDNEKQVWIDVFDRGETLAFENVKERAVLVAGRWQDSFARPSSKRQILIRMLENLRGLAAREGETNALNQYLEALLVLEPDSASFRGMRAVTRFQLGQKAAAIEDLTWVIEHPPRGLNLTPVLEMRRRFTDELELERQAAEERTH